MFELVIKLNWSCIPMSGGVDPNKSYEMHFTLYTLDFLLRWEGKDKYVIKIVCSVTILSDSW